MSGPRILIVEDDPHFGRQLVDLFEFHGYMVKLVDSGPAAIEAFEAGGASLVLTDLMLPTMGGVELVRCIRGLPGGYEIPVLMMSAVYKDPRLFENELRTLGIVEFLPKPFSLIDLIRKVDVILDESLALGAHEAMVTATGSWRLKDIDEVLGEGTVRFDASGSFDRRTLLNLFIEIFRKHAAGTLVLKQGAATRSVYFLNGYPVWATSQEESERLGEVMVRSGSLSREQVEAALERAERDGTMFVDAVLRLGLLSEAALFRAERERVKTVVIESFAWAQGQYSFDNSDDFITEVGIYEVNPLRCLAAAVRRFLTINELAADLERHSEQNFIEGARFQRLFPYIELPESLSGLVDCMDRGIRVSQLFGRFAANNELLIKYLWLMFNLGIADSLPSLDNGAASDD